MDSSWDSTIPTPSPEVKQEASPMDSLLSEPNGVYPSLFPGSAMAPCASSPQLDASATSLPLFLTDGDGISAFTKSGSFEPMTPLPEEAMSDAETPDPESADAGDHGDNSSPGKKPTKKRKSWGQVLPEPKTNLPPRKRAKTEDEKEQRRVERVLRNRRAAQSSRERKRLEVEALEKRNQDLEEELKKARRENMMLFQQLAHAQGNPVVIPNGNGPVTLSQELFSTPPSATLDSFLASQSAATINPVSLSPSLPPVPDTSDLISTIDGQEKTTEKTVSAEPAPTQTAKTQPTKQTTGNVADQPEPSAVTDTGASVKSDPESSPDMTQRPAATLCPDLQCLSAEESRVWTVSQKATPLATALVSQMTLLLTLSSVMISACCRPMTQIAISLKAGISIPPSPAILTSIIWLITTPSARSRPRTLTSTTSSTPMDTTCHLAATSTLPTPASPSLARPVTTLRLKMLRKILTCNPMLARPLKDATLRLLRSVCSEKLLDSVSVGKRARPGTVQAVQWAEAGIAADGSWQNTATLPSQEVLLTLLWALRVEERRQFISAKAKSMPPALTKMSRKGLMMPSLKRSSDVMCLDGETTLPTASRRKQRRLD